MNRPRRILPCALVRLNRGLRGDCWRAGFTMIDFLVTAAVFVTVVSLASVSLVAGRKKTEIASFQTQLAADLRNQQLKAMLGDTEGRGVTDTYGVHLTDTSYVLFHGSSYSPGSSDNFVVTLPGDVQFANILLPGQNVIFSKGSGEVAGYTAGQDSWQLVSLGANKTKLMQVNRYGVLW